MAEYEIREDKNELSPIFSFPAYDVTGCGATWKEFFYDVSSKFWVYYFISL